MKNPVFVALDLDDVERVRELATELGPLAGGLKLGPRMINRAGSSLVQEVAESAPVFIDQKFYDIPNTMESAVRTAFESGASFATIHASSGPEAMTRLARVEEELNRDREFRILVVTLVTSFSAENLPVSLKGRGPESLVIEMAKEAWGCGLKSFVCSPFEATNLRELFPESFLVTPGIRPAGADLNDQKRVTTPKEAIKKGASAMVIGRPIVEAADPKAVLESILDSLK